jgi:aldehyde:ferredoxin oxidoreductase
VAYLNQMGILPTENFKRGTFEKYESLTGELLFDDYMIKRDTCTACPISCKRVVETEFNGEKVDPKYGGPEYETIGAFGSACMIADLAAVSLANQKCNAYGLDTIGTGMIIAAAIEATEKGLMESDLSWGNAEAMIAMIEKIAHREGLGDELAKGIKNIADTYGEEVAMHIKGQELPLHDPRGKLGFGLSYSTSPRGATHLEGMHDSMLERENVTPEFGVTEALDRLSWDNKPEMAVLYENIRSFTNSCVLCQFTTQMVGPGYNYGTVRKLVQATTGIELTPESMLEVGARNFDLLKLLANREGYTRADDGLHPRLMGALPDGGSADRPIEADTLNEMIDRVYALRGWDHHGPTDDKLTSSGMGDLAGTVSR